MKAIFRVTEGPIEHESLVVRNGEKLTIGRAENADVAVPQDGQMSSLHLSIECEDGKCVIHDLDSTNGTWLNDEQVRKRIALSTGDVLRIGTTTFRVELQGARQDDPAEESEKSAKEAIEGSTTVPPAQVTVAAADDADNAVGGDGAREDTASTEPSEDRLEAFLKQDRGFTEETAKEICDRFQVPDLPAPPEADESPDKYAERLAGDPETADAALIFLAYALPKRCSVWWASQCVRQAIPDASPEDMAILEAAEAWVAAPSDETRRKAMQLAEKLDCGTAACWAGVGAYWSHGSMAPPDVPPVPPKDEFTGKATSGAVALAAVDKFPEQAPQRRTSFVQMALAVAAGENSWK